MCGRYAFYSPAEATAALFGVSNAAQVVRPGYNIAPTQTVAVVRRDSDDVAELAGLRWGLVPFWAKDPSIGNRMINARAETVAEKPSFRAAFRKRRCLLLAGWFLRMAQARRRQDPVPDLGLRRSAIRIRGAVGKLAGQGVGGAFANNDNNNHSCQPFYVQASSSNAGGPASRVRESLARRRYGDA